MSGKMSDNAKHLAVRQRLAECAVDGIESEIDLRAQLQTANADLQASTEQHIMDDDIIVGLRAKLAEAEARVEQDVARREAAVDEAQRMVDRYVGETCFWQEQAKHEGEFKAIYRRRFEQAETKLAEAERERDAWMEIARQNQRNTDYYRGLVVRAGQVFGIAARTQDDGGICEDVLCAKVPELVEQAEAERKRLQEELEAQREVTLSWQDRDGVYAEIAALREALKTLSLIDPADDTPEDVQNIARAALATPSKAEDAKDANK